MPLKPALAALLLVLQAACTTLPADAGKASPCAVSEASMACQVERYNNVNAD